MPFPFMPLGAVVATLFLGTLFCVLYLLVTRLDRAIVEVGGVVVGRLVAGLDDWNHDREGPRHDPLITVLAASAVLEPFEDASPVPVEPSRRSGP